MNSSFETFQGEGYLSTFRTSRVAKCTRASCFFYFIVYLTIYNIVLLSSYFFFVYSLQYIFFLLRLWIRKFSCAVAWYPNPLSQLTVRAVIKGVQNTFKKDSFPCVNNWRIFHFFEQRCAFLKHILRFIEKFKKIKSKTDMHVDSNNVQGSPSCFVFSFFMLLQ